MMRRHAALVLALMLLPGCGDARSGEDALRALSPGTSRAGAVAAPHPAAAEIGIEVLRNGGNAVDAAVAMGFALAVCLPYAGNLGGGGFLLVRTADGEAVVIDFRETAPALASRDIYLDAQGAVIPDSSLTGHRAVAVPGTVAGLALALERYGTLSLAEALSPAIHLASTGVAVTPGLAPRIAEAALRTGRFPYADALLRNPRGDPWGAGEMWRQPDLARTLRAIAAGGVAEFYRGSIARLIVREMERGGGLITAEDLAAYRPVVRAPVRGTYRGHEIISTPPPSSGGVALIEILKILEGFPLPSMTPHDPQTIHLVSEACRRVFADRARYLGDPEFTSIPVDMLVSEAYAAERRRTIDLARATPSGEVAAGEAAPLPEGHDTTHLSVVDRLGNVAALTYTLNTSFGSLVAVDGAGFFLNNEMDDFSARPGVPNYFGLVGAEANAIAPGKRPLSSMAPTIVLRDGQPVMVLGSPGGPTIITSLLQVILGRVDFGLSPQDAVAAPRYHHQWLPDAIQVEEARLPPEVTERLQAMGHRVTARDRMGEVQAIFIDPASGIREAVSDPRALDGTALGE